MNIIIGEVVCEFKIVRIIRGNLVCKGGICKDGFVVSWGEGVKYMSFFFFYRLWLMLERDMGIVYCSLSFVY